MECFQNYVVGYGMSKSVSKSVEIIGRESWNVVNDKSVKPSVYVMCFEL